MHGLLEKLTGIAKAVLLFTGYPGVIFFMALESACFPVPSELIMPIAGWLAAEGKMTLWSAAIAGAVGCMLGSALAWWVGINKGREFALKYGKYILLSHKDMDLADRWFQRWGQPMVFLARLLPVIRTFISLPAGIYKMRFTPFIVLSFVGSLPWCYLLAWLGYKGKEFEPIWKPWYHKFEYLIIALVLIGGVWWVWRHWKHSREQHVPMGEASA